MGKASRDKGARFEREVRDRVWASLRDAGCEGYVVRRSSQAHQPEDSDVVVSGDGAPPWIRAVWWECNHADNPDPSDKLRQARDDVQRVGKATRVERYPVVVWRKTGARSTRVTARLVDVLAIWGVRVSSVSGLLVEVTLDFDDFLLTAIRRNHEEKQGEWALEKIFDDRVGRRVVHASGPRAPSQDDGGVGPPERAPAGRRGRRRMGT